MRWAQKPVGRFRKREVFFDTETASSSAGIVFFPAVRLPAEGSMRRTTGFTLIELSVVVAIIAILVVIAFANVRSGRGSANEASTIGFFKKAVISHEQYRTRFGRYPSAFAELVNSGFFADAQNPSGYSLTYSPAVDSWSFQGSPKELGETGDRYFYVNQTGVIRSALDGPANAKSAPLEATVSGNEDVDSGNEEEALTANG